ncbi:MAG: CDP-glycerol glycerophosphotransferase family protein, partial [Chlamydiia bacterium]|nr:CDP-glycerol glycerophosphotransferase family protein [Chlamydiia bacterium]
LNTAPESHLLDHIAPLADLLNIPLILSSEEMYSLAETYYPEVQKELMEDMEFQLKELAGRFDALVECKYWLPHLKTIFKNLYRKEMDLIFCPHGQSDKGFAKPLLAPYAQQDIILLYGEMQMHMLKTLNIWETIDRFAFIGNYRLLYYQKHKKYLDQLVEEKIFSHLSPNLPTMLYAPTWKDADQSTSFFHWGQKIAKEKPADWNLIVKVHPLLEKRDPASYYKLAYELQNVANLLLISDFPPVYPLLARTDVYLGDYSSVGYDFLYFERPMFFFSHPHLPTGALQSCGKILSQDHSPFSFLAQLDNKKYIEKQKKLYNYAFGSGNCKTLFSTCRKDKNLF